MQDVSSSLDAARQKGAVLTRIVGLADAVGAARGWRASLIAIVSGAASVLAMAPFFAFPVLFFTLPVLVWLMDGASQPGARSRPDVRRAAVAGWMFGFGYFFAGLFWIGEAFLVEADKFGWLLPVAVTVLPAGLALFWGAASGLARLIAARGIARVLVLAVTLAGAEWLRGHILTGFPWNVLGYALTYPLAMMQAAGVLGIYGLTLWAVAIFAAPLVAVADARDPHRLTRSAAWVGGLSIGALAIQFAYGAVVLSLAPTTLVEGVKIRVVQPSVPQRDKWRPEKQREIFELHLALSRQNASGSTDNMDGITHVVWPEAAMPFRPLDHPEALEAIGAAFPVGTYLMTGALRVESLSGTDAAATGSRKAYNSLMVFGPGGALAGLYDKIHLVPFGEYLPLQATLEALGLEQLSRLRGGFSSGATPRRLLSVGHLPRIGVLICYEAIFPGEIVQGGQRPDVFVNVTNDGWFGNSAGPRQHLHQSRVRAVEEGLPMVRSANNGISAMIDPHGRMLATLALNERAVFDTSVPAPLAAPLYARVGDAMFLVNLMLFGALAMFLGRRTELGKIRN